MYFLLKMGIFHCYLSLPEGSKQKHVNMYELNMPSPCATHIDSRKWSSSPKERESQNKAGSILGSTQLPCLNGQIYVIVIKFPSNSIRPFAEFLKILLSPLKPEILTWNLKNNHLIEKEKSFSKAPFLGFQPLIFQGVTMVLNGFSGIKTSLHQF